MKESVYIETTVISYLTAWLSRDLIRAAHQQITQNGGTIGGMILNFSFPSS